MTKPHLYCFVDESGQDTLGKYFLVVAVLVEHAVLQAVEASLQDLEMTTRKSKSKWTKTAFPIRQQFLRDLPTIQELKASIYYSIYKDTKEYTVLTALTIAKAILATQQGDYSATIVVDGLNKASTEQIKIELKQLKIRYKTIRGMKDEQNSLIRLADCLGGFLRDYSEQQSYTIPIFQRLQQQGILVNI